jgi:dihydroxyacid dehydratase/phosphogluconate dehydratase
MTQQPSLTLTAGHGVVGLRVCDASLLPSIICANTNIPTVMITGGSRISSARDERPSHTWEPPMKHAHKFYIDGEWVEPTVSRAARSSIRQPSSR